MYFSGLDRKISAACRNRDFIKCGNNEGISALNYDANQGW